MSLASPAATEQPTLNRAWQAFLAHVPTMLLIWVTTAVISAVGLAIYLGVNLIVFAVAGGENMSDAASVTALAVGQLGQLPFSILSSLVGVLFTAVPALHYATGETIGIEAAFRALWARPWRYLLAGLLFSLAVVIGLLLCVLPGIAVALVMPVYVNKVFNTDLPVPDALRDFVSGGLPLPAGLGVCRDRNPHGPGRRRRVSGHLWPGCPGGGSRVQLLHPERGLPPGCAELSGALHGEGKAAIPRR